MRTITATELARNLRDVLDRLVAEGEEVVVERNHQQVARIIPGAPRQTALQAMGDLYRTLPEEAARDWAHDSRVPAEAGLEHELRDPWAS